MPLPDHNDNSYSLALALSGGHDLFVYPEASTYVFGVETCLEKDACGYITAEARLTI